MQCWPALDHMQLSGDALLDSYKATVTCGDGSLQCSYLPDHSRPTFHEQPSPQMGQDLSSQANADEFSRKLAGQKQDRLPAPSRLQGRRLLSGIAAGRDSLRGLSLAYGLSNGSDTIRLVDYQRPRRLSPALSLYNTMSNKVILRATPRRYAAVCRNWPPRSMECGGRSTAMPRARFECHASTTPNVN
ncbi:hypothetical protein GGI35DRAFT_100903 [Trichoderma velutinum]